MVESLALSRPEVGFFLHSDGQRSLAFPAAADLRERISQVHGLSLARSLVALEDPVVWGFASPLAISFPTRRYLHVAVNGRVVEADSFAPAVGKIAGIGDAGNTTRAIRTLTERAILQRSGDGKRLRMALWYSPLLWARVPASIDPPLDDAEARAVLEGFGEWAGVVE